MALSAGTRTLLREAAIWTAFAVTFAMGAAHYTDLRNFAAETLAQSTATVRVNDRSHEFRSARYQAGPVELHADAQGHFSSSIEINGSLVNAMVDTGATVVALSYEDAERSGIRLSAADFTHQVRTANGFARVAPVTLDRVQIGSIELRNVAATVSERGRMSGSLLGMSFLGRLSRLEMRAGTLILHN